MPPLILVAIAWVAGLIAAHHWLVPVGVEPASLVLLSLIPLAAILLWRKDRTMVLSGVCALAFVLGALRYQIHIPDFDDPKFVAHHNQRGWVTLEGVVRTYPDVRDTWTGLYLDTESIEVDGQVHQVQGKVLVRAPRFPEYQYGDRLRVSGHMETPPEFEEFSYRDYLERQGVYALVNRPRIDRLASRQGSPFWEALITIKDRARDTIARLIPDPEASLMQGILLGIESGIPRDLYDDFNATGTSHIIVISGANITVVAALFASIFGRLLGKRRAYWFTMVGIILYVLLVGADPVVIRAGVMGSLFVTALYLGRRATAHVSLFASVIVLTVINPFALWNIGFQLSFAAVLGLILFAPTIERIFERMLTRVISVQRTQEIGRYVNDVLIVTLAAQVLTIPLIVYRFGRLSLIAPLSNLLILPVQPLIMISGGLATLIGLVPPLEPIARVIAWVPWLGLAYTNTIVRWMATWPSASLQIGHAGTGWLLAYGVLLLAAAWALRHTRDGIERLWNSESSTKFIGGMLLIAAVLIWLAVLQLPDGRLHVAFLDIGQGDAILITTPRGQQVLVDGGPSPTALMSALGKEMPFWDRSIDLLVMTHSDADHITGLTEVLDRYQVEGWLDNGCADDDATYQRCQDLLEEAEIPRHLVRAGDRVELEQGLVLEVLHPPRTLMTGTDATSNNNSLVLRLVWQQASFLFAGDVEAEGEQVLVWSEQPLAARVLKVAHHGSSSSSTAEFLSAVRPNYAIISVGADNHFGHPDQAVLNRLAQLGDNTILRTDERGTVEFVTDGRQLWLQTQR
jgi:competence protein ComEC